MPPSDHDRYAFTGSSSVPTDDAPDEDLGQVVVLPVADINEVGIFLEEGRDKQLLLPRSELHGPVRVGDDVVVVILNDSHGRRYASNQITRHLDFGPAGLPEGTALSILVYSSNARGFLCVVNGRHPGMLFRDRTHQPVRAGDQLGGFVSQVQPDGKLDLSLTEPGVNPFPDDLDRLRTLLAAEGFIDLHDKSPSDQIRSRLGMSKKAFKRAVGALYRDRLVVLEDGGVRWVG